jgi:hypothetical protein
MQDPSHHVPRVTLHWNSRQLPAVRVSNWGSDRPGRPPTRLAGTTANGKLRLPYRRSRCDDPTDRYGVVMTVIQEPTYNNRPHNCLLLNGLFIPYILRTGKAIVCTTTALTPPHPVHLPPLSRDKWFWALWKIPYKLSSGRKLVVVLVCTIICSRYRKAYASMISITFVNDFNYRHGLILNWSFMYRNDFDL